MPDMGGSPQDKAKDLAGQAQEKAQDAREQARGRLRDQVDQRSTQAGSQVTSTADDVRSVAVELRNQGKDAPARYAEQAADRVQRAGEWLRDSDGDRILRDVESFARRNTWAVAAAGLALGFAASRMLKASSSDRYRTSLGSNGYDGGRLPARQPSDLSTEPMPSGREPVPERFTRDAPAGVPDPAAPTP
ncbi:MAG TPA: hypothetical protein VK307_02340 [Thermoleophilaceae bacterium]|nr:hypothetical protein [Thermoleophilaceae bacterium]